MNLEPKKVNVMGMELDRFVHGSCTADFGTGEDFATLYYIESTNKCCGHATQLLTYAKKYYEDRGKKFGGSVALNEGMKRIYKKLKITEYD